MATRIDITREPGSATRRVFPGLARRLGSALSFALCVSLVACAASPPPATPAPAPTPDPVVVVETVVERVVDTVEVPAEPDAELERRIATLQLQLLERAAQVEDLQRRLDTTRQEGVRAMARLQSLASRAEAASAMAEAEVALEAVAGAERDEEAPEAAQARHLLVLSTTEFTNENYGGALYLASLARNVARVGEVRLTGGEQRERQPGEALFALPLALETGQRSNVRAGPGIGFPVLVTLDLGTPVVGHSYVAQWVRITFDQGRDGWIFHSLVTNPREGDR